MVFQVAFTISVGLHVHCIRKLDVETFLRRRFLFEAGGGIATVQCPNSSLSGALIMSKACSDAGLFRFGGYFLIAAVWLNTSSRYRRR